MSQSDLRAVIRDLIAPEASRIADAFYEGMLKEPRATLFLESRLVDQRLRGSMTAWIVDTFSAVDDAAIENQRRRHTEVGTVHARVDVPMSLVNQGMRILRRECCALLRASRLERDELAKALLLVVETLDEAAGLINESYLDHLLDNERNDQSLRLHVVSQNLAIECERLRSGLFNWMRRSLVALFSESPSADSPGALAESELGLWIAHKAELLFPDLPETKRLAEQVGLVDASVDKARRLSISSDRGNMDSAIGLLDREITQTAWLLSSLAEQALETERARDPLTRVLSRRYLPSILQREIRLSIKRNAVFAVLLIDIDDFKQLNDSLGHSAGDTVLRAIAEMLLTTLRASDFVFRYGGDEFLAILGHSSEAQALEVAERLRGCVESHRFNEFDRDRSVTVSIGIALHEGHPDYNHVFERADRALMQAKSLGRNRCELAPEVPVAADPGSA